MKPVPMLQGYYGDERGQWNVFSWVGMAHGLRSMFSESTALSQAGNASTRHSPFRAPSLRFFWPNSFRPQALSTMAGTGVELRLILQPLQSPPVRTDPNELDFTPPLCGRLRPGRDVGRVNPKADKDTSLRGNHR